MELNSGDQNQPPQDDDQQPKRRRRIWNRPREGLGTSRIQHQAGDPLRADGGNPAYVEWLRKQSMLGDASVIGRGLAGRSSMWRNTYAMPDPRRALNAASVWFTTYPAAFITREDQSFLAAIADEELWDAFEQIGIGAIHTGPTKLAGGIVGWQFTPSVDGQFDRISTRIDKQFGNETEFQALADVAEQYGGIIIDDIVPGHTGKGADFRLAEISYKDYPGIYHMVEIPEEDWDVLPEVPEGGDSVNISPESEVILTQKGHIIGSLQRVIFYEPGVKETNWSATRPVLGVDGKVRRWVYLHYFKEGQPTLNWLDPTYSAMRLVTGDALHSLGDLGASALRLDANGFLAAERGPDGQPAWSEGHPLSHAANQFIASMIRKVGGFSFQELNLTVEDIRDAGLAGADLSYDFITRPGYQHALLTGDTEFLRLTLRTSLEAGIQPVSLIHGLQNHDELTYELVHWESRHMHDEYEFRDDTITGAQLAATIRGELQHALVGRDIDYNLVFTTNGIACTMATVSAAALGVTRLEQIEGEVTDAVRRAHLLLAAYNAWQPGVFALSAWDMLGALTVPRGDVAGLIGDGDTRWIERGGVDLMGVNPEATHSPAGLPRARTLYGSLPEQLADDASFANRLRELISIRERYRLPFATQLDVPDVSDPALLVLVHRLDDGDPTATDAQLQITVLNFANRPIVGTIRSEQLPPRRLVSSAVDRETIGRVDDLHSFPVSLGPHEAQFLLVGGEDVPTQAIPIITPDQAL
ncbi:maltose alpha-D-glucosyltransferase [Gulosibacter molinativorax]|uniref:maltose alpha-D-glucosyltransferase n=1 Tax=Gulosibacter molinativorax TaxID=256821 RepID=UPI00040E5C60|nr:maltose alpha-D-glucosyltransferase [Gulosibacter molinativorax]QUY62481.1 Putative alpha glycosidase [Gulosibacter molinativorax]